MAIQRFEIDELVSSTQNGLVDVLDWLGFLCAQEYLVALLRNTHQIPAVDAAKRAEKIIPHVRLASGYIRQSQDGPSELSFLPAYYAILNLMKVYVLLGPRHDKLAANRWHGATYEVGGKDSHSVMTEEIKLRRNGVFPLFYETLTGQTLGNRGITLKVRDFLPFVVGIGHEYVLATGYQSPLCSIQLFPALHNGVQHVHANVLCGLPQSPTESIPSLRGYNIIPGPSRAFRGPQLVNPQAPFREIRASLNTHLLYRISAKGTSGMIVPKRKLQLPQELPTALLFFYMSSVVRYRPEFFARLRDSKYWPVISSARVHAFLDFLLAAWCYFQKRNYFINAQ